MGSKVLTILALLALPVQATAAEEEAPSEVFSQSVEVRVVNIDIAAVDKKGRPVEGLTKDDFVLRVDGVEVPIEYFYSSHAEGRSPREVEGDAPEPAAEEAAQAAAPYRPAPADDPLVVVYIDNFWLTPVERKRVLDDVQGFVRAQPAGRRFLVATHDPGIAIRTPVTRDADRVVAALEALHEAPTHGLVAVRERSSVFDEIRSIWESCRAEPCDCWGEMLALWEVYAQSATHRVEVALGGMRELLASLGGIPGRKSILYVASGLQLRPGVDILQFLSELCPRYQRDINFRLFLYDEGPSLEEVGARANTSRATFYPLDAGGLRADSAASVQWSDSRFRPSGLISNMERANLQAPHQLLAGATGGRAIVNANRPLEPLLDLAASFGKIYSLGFTPAAEPDGEKHGVHVELRGRHRGVRLRYRRSYVDEPLDRRLIDRLIAAITFSAEVNPLGVRASLGEPTPLARNVVSLPVEVTVPVAHLTLASGADGESTGRFRVFLTARSSAGGRTDVRQEFFDVTPEIVEQGGTAIVVRMFLEPDEYTVGVGVRDEIGAVASYLTLQTGPLDPDPAE